MSEEIIKWGDAQQYHAEPHTVGISGKGEFLGVQPEVHLLWMTPDPLGAIAAMSAMYSGRVVRSLGEMTDNDRQKAFADVQQTHLQAPLEAVKLHFLIEGVDRAFTHQLVRQRTAVYAQESMRFAVLGDLGMATTLPPSLADKRPDDPFRKMWEGAIDGIDTVYHNLVNGGIPAEEARGLLPHATATRLHYITDMRNLKDHAGNRLCTQAQFVWRQVFSKIVGAISSYDEHWQFRALADSGLFRPVCYQLNRCPFQASFDRACTIRDRVNEYERAGVNSKDWSGINPAEWLLDPSAAREEGGGGREG
jgi:Thymidylate synthase complementing protein